MSRSDDLNQLWEEGYDIAIDGGWLLVRQLPYVDRSRSVRYGTLAIKLALDVDITTTPDDHTALFSGDEPCDDGGQPLEAVINSRGMDETMGGQHFKLRFSQKLVDNGQKRQYRDYHEQVTTYAEILYNYAYAVDDTTPSLPTVRLPPIEVDYPFNYSDTASVRADTSTISRKLAGQIIGIIGLGGTGSYIADLAAKTYVRELHLWDEDSFQQHNAFRAPGAASIHELQQRPFKCAYFQQTYSKIHSHVVAHPYHMNADHFHELDALDFVFVAVDRGPSRGIIVPALLDRGIPFIDVGMGLIKVDQKLSGQVRVTLVADGENSAALTEIPMSEDVEDGEYRENIQIADMNALNAVLAVIKWKKHMGVYADFEQEWDSAYIIDGNQIVNISAD